MKPLCGVKDPLAQQRKSSTPIHRIVSWGFSFSVGEAGLKRAQDLKQRRPLTDVRREWPAGASWARPKGSSRPLTGAKNGPAPPTTAVPDRCAKRPSELFYASTIE